MATQTIDTPTLLSEKLNEALEKRNMTVQDLNKAVGATYEHVRKIVKGEGIPSKYMLRAMCEVLKLPYKDMERLNTADRIRVKFGTIPLELAGKLPRWESLERLDAHLSEADMADLLALAESRAKRNRAEARS